MPKPVDTGRLLRDSAPVTTKAWFNKHHQLVPGRELFRSERRFQIWAYTTSHGQLLIRATPRFWPDEPGDGDDTTIDVLFKPLRALKLRDSLDGLVIRCARADETSQIMDSAPGVDWTESHVFILESQGQADYVVSMAMGWEEGVLPRMQQSFFAEIVPGDKWPTTELFGVGAGFEVASLPELVGALAEDSYPPRRRDRCRYLRVLMVKPSPDADAYAAGVFLTEEDAAEAQKLFAPKVHQCWFDWAPVAL